MYRQGIPAIVVLCMSIATHAADTRAVQADYDRCKQVMTRVERSIRRYETELVALKKSISHAPPDRKEHLAIELQSLESRIEYFRNRFERSRAQSDKIRDDLKALSGPTCPSCVESSVNLYCRSSETLQRDIDEHLGKATDLRARIGMKSAIDKDDYDWQRVTADSLYRTLSNTLHSCSDKSVATLLEQARINLDRAERFLAAGDLDGANKSLDIALSLLDTAQGRCGDKK